MLKIQFHYAFHELIEQKSKEINQKYQDFIKDTEFSLLKSEIEAFIEEKNQFLRSIAVNQKQSFFNIRSEKLFFNNTKIFNFTKEAGAFGIRYLMFMEEKERMFQKAFKIIEEQNLEPRYLVEEEIVSEINELFEKEPLFSAYPHALKFISNPKDEGVSVVLEFEPEKGLENKEGEYTYVLGQVSEEMNKKYYYYNNLKSRLISQCKARFYSLRSELIQKVQKKVQEIVPDSKDLFGFLLDVSIEKTNTPSKHYGFSKNKVVLHPRFLFHYEEESEQFVKDFAVVKKVYDKFRNIHHRICKEFSWTDENLEEGFSFERKLISLNINDFEAEMLAKNIIRIRNEVYQAEFHGVKPKRDLTFLNRYFVKKINQFKIGNDIYEVFEYRGKSVLKRTTFKNDEEMSVSQGRKAFKKYQKINKSPLSHSHCSGVSRVNVSYSYGEFKGEN